ncbi:MAG: DUF4363 family protein [Clostridia bacterium]|nr:DUF4363 family protein [Clostridia bacterium]
MYKEVIISIVIAIIIFGLNFITQSYTKNAVVQVSEKLDNTRKELTKEAPDYEIAFQKAEDTLTTWEGLDDTIALYIEHTEIEKVKTAIISMKSFIQMEDASQAVDSIDRCCYVLENIKQREEFSIDNIF